MSDIAKNLHDRAFYRLMSHRDFALSVFKRGLPNELQAKIDWTSLNLWKLGAKQVSENLKQERYADIVYSGVLGEEESFFIKAFRS